jgi:hypothetical protein
LTRVPPDVVRSSFDARGREALQCRRRPTVGHGNADQADAASALSARTARRLAVDSERAVAWAWSPRPIDILVRISLYERTGSRPTEPKNPVSSSFVAKLRM